MSPWAPIPPGEVARAVQFVEASFPHLRGSPYEAVSHRDQRYNCIAFAAGVTDQWWEPVPHGRAGVHWPPQAPNEYTIEAFVAAFGTLGYVLCHGPNVEPGVEKVVLYVKDDRPTHAARQTEDGWWVSKLGRSYDIEHRYVGSVSSPDYGEPKVYLRRPRPGSTSAGATASASGGAS